MKEYSVSDFMLDYAQTIFSIALEAVETMHIVERICDSNQFSNLSSEFID